MAAEGFALGFWKIAISQRLGCCKHTNISFGYQILFHPSKYGAEKYPLSYGNLRQFPGIFDTEFCSFIFLLK